MLGLSAQANVISSAWEAADERTAMPPSAMGSFFAAMGATPSCAVSRRSFHRYYMRSKALLIQGERVYAVYTTDVSRHGVGFLAPRQLLPHERWTLQMFSGAKYEVLIKRCRRQSNQCFACGGRFTPASAPTAPGASHP